MAVIIYHMTEHNGNRTLGSEAPYGKTLNDFRKYIMFLSAIEGSDTLNIRGLGHEYYTPGKVVHRAHQVYCIRYVIDGYGTFNGKPIARGYAYFSVPGVEYRIQSDVEHPMEQYWIDFWGASAPGILKQMFGTIEPGVYPFHFADVLNTIFDPIMLSTDNRIDHRTDMFTAIYKLMAYHVKENETNVPILTHSAKLFYDATKFIEAHYNEQITVNLICDKLHIVPDYLYKIFRQYTGLSTQNYLINYRMSIASSLLTKSDLPIGMIGSRVGYNDQSQFSRVFRKFSGKTPQEYRKMIVENSQVKTN